MASLEDLREERRKKLETLKERGIDPYPARTKKDFTVKEFLSAFDTLSDKQTSLAGRIMSLRKHGGSIFFDIYDGTASVQGYIKKDEMKEESFSSFDELIDRGDFVSIEGKPFVTKKGEQSLLVSSWDILTKSLRPLPEKWHGLQDTELRFRQRYLDLLIHKDIRDMFLQKSRFWDVTRDFLKKNNFLEVETPTLEVTTGGAEATPFQTHHNDFDMDVYLRISVGELWQKRLMGAGYPKTFEIGRIYRNEGSSPEHLQEFTSMEFYAAYMDYREGMEFTKEMIKKVVADVFGKTKFTTRGHTFDLGGTWEEIEYVNVVKEMTGINVLEAGESEMESKLKELGVDYAGENKERLTDSLWKYCRKQISGPSFLIHHPKLVSPLSKALPENPLLTERVQLILAGSEVTNGFSELNDPIDQKERFEAQKKLLDGGDSEAMMYDWEYVEMLEYGIPPTFGFAYGDRLFSFLVDKPIRETILFPLMKPQNQ